MINSILTSTKKRIGIASEDTSFDSDIIDSINSVFSTLNQMGVGPPLGFTIEDESDEWEDYVEDKILENMIRTYMYLKVRLVFDPPAMSFHIQAMEKQINEQEGRISLYRETSLDPAEPGSRLNTPTELEEEVNYG